LNETLYFEEYGQSGHPVIIFLHGLLGSSRNWRSVAKALSQEYKIYALDLPEHGSSPHSSSTNLTEMSQMVGEWISSNVAGDYILCGHSLGGKVAMGHACQEPGGIKGLVVVDIAPRDYPPEHHLPTLHSLLNLDLNALKSRKEAEVKLSQNIPNWAFRQFLLTNLVEVGGTWKWRANLPVLHASMLQLSRNPLLSEDSYDGPTLFIRGGKSGYLRSEHFSLVKEAFPVAEIVTLAEAGHDVHVEDKDGFLKYLKEFLENLV
jgi:esterase